ncbi:MAG: hypothetical protein KAI17_19190 [Thiotrichaceae bacterium]|nr:hypothetical protein [Thiotrichaceae bacterium]
MKILEVFGNILGKFIAFSEIDQELSRKQSAPQQQQPVNYETSEAHNKAEVDDFESDQMFEEFFD